VSLIHCGRRCSMSAPGKTRKIVVIATGAAVALSATAVVLMQQHVTNEHAAIQRALRSGVDHATNTNDASEWFKLACSGRTCRDG
jgi:molybdopterin biosynthesis enzyme